MVADAQHTSAYNDRMRALSSDSSDYHTYMSAADVPTFDHGKFDFGYFILFVTVTRCRRFDALLGGVGHIDLDRSSAPAAARTQYQARNYQ
jgi:hypothetical protein